MSSGQGGTKWKGESVIKDGGEKRGREGAVFIRNIRRFNIASRTYGRFKATDAKYLFWSEENEWNET